VGPPSSLTMTSLGKLSGMKRDVSHAEELATVKDQGDDAVSTTSAYQEKDLK